MLHEAIISTSSVPGRILNMHVHYHVTADSRTRDYVMPLVRYGPAPSPIVTVTVSALQGACTPDSLLRLRAPRRPFLSYSCASAIVINPICAPQSMVQGR